MILTPRQLVQKADFYRQLGQMTEVGLTLQMALETALKHAQSGPMKRALPRVIESIHQGSSFGEALLAQGRWMPAFDIALLGAGEQSGRLPACFLKLAGYYDDRARLLRRVLASLAYPIFLVHIAALVFPIGALQNLVTQGAIGYFLLTKVLILGPIYLTAGVIAYYSQSDRSEFVRRLLDRVLDLTPVVGSSRRSMALSRFCLALEALINAGVGTIHAFELSAVASGSFRLQNASRDFRSQLESGVPPSQMLHQAGIFPTEFLQQYHSAELSGKIDETLVRLHKYYEDQGARQSHLAVVLGGGIIFGVVIITIAWQVIQFWLGYFNQINQVIP
jgi:type II secretory pathway component PulF